MKSVFFRRLLIVMVMVMMLTTIAMALGCGVVGIKIYENITLEEMVPKAGTVADLVRELGYGHISREAFLRIAQSYVEASDSTTLVFSKDKEIILAANMPNGDDEQEVYSTLSDTMDKIISGDTVKSESLAIKGIGDTLSAGVPITDDSGNIYDISACPNSKREHAPNARADIYGVAGWSAHNAAAHELALQPVYRSASQDVRGRHRDVKGQFRHKGK